MTSSSIAKAILVVTGAWHVPDHYRKLIASLEDKGIRVICPRLPTNNGATPPSKTIFDDIDLIREIVSSEVEKGTQLTVLAHSYGGAVCTVALGEFAYPINGDRAKGGVTDLIYVASFLPKEGESLADLCGGGLPPFVFSHDDGTLTVDTPAHYFYNDLPEAEAKKAVDMLVVHQVKAQFTSLQCEKAAWRVIPTSYLICEADTAFLPQFQEIMVARLVGEGVKIREFRCSGGHSAFLSVPEEVAKVALEVMGSR